MAYLRFLTNKDYCSIATKEHISQLVRDVPDRIPQAEQRAEMNFLEYLDQYYDIARILAVGKNIRDYNVAVSYPSGVWIKKDEQIYKTLTAINGYKAPTKKEYWTQVVDFIDPFILERAKRYSQLRMYAKGEVVRFGTEYWQCQIPHGYEANEIHIPGVSAWKEANITPWEPNMTWEKNQVCSYNGSFYQYLKDTEDEETTEKTESEETTESATTEADTDTESSTDAGTDTSTNADDTDTDTSADSDVSTGTDTEIDSDTEETVVTPDEDDNWGLIGDYDKSYEYDYSEDAFDYVVAEETVFYPVMNPNADELTDGVNITADDPRHAGVVAHMSRIALYYLHQIISPTNISETRRWAYEDSMKWLSDASKFKINPQLPRKIDRETGEKKVDWALETFQREYNPFENPWLT